MKKNPGRFAKRGKPGAQAQLGAPPKWFKQRQRVEWNRFKRELAWLTESHRALLEIACVIRARLAAGEDVGIQALNLLRQCLGQMGATPADESKINQASDDEGDDPAQDYLS